MKKLLLCMFIVLMGLQGKVISQTPNDTIVLIKKQFNTAFFILDGPVCPNQCYETNIIVDTFPEGPVIRNANDVTSLCMKMGHSFRVIWEFILSVQRGRELH